MLEVLDRMDRPVVTPLDGRPRGVALVLAMITIVILSAAVVEFAYSTRVNTAMATNERDNLKSYYLAKSGVNLSRLILSFQYALQEESRDTEDEMGQLIGRAMRRSNFQLYQYVDLLMGPFNSGAVEIPLASVDLAGMGVGGFGDFTGRFDVDVEPEEGRININEFAREEIRETDLMQFCSAIIDARYDRIFEERDQFGDLMDRRAMTANIVDFIDLNFEATRLTDQCTIDGRGGDEGRPYSRDDDYDIVPRNARLTHIEELYRVHGVNEAFMKTFTDAFTVYNVGRPNLNVASAPVFYAVLCRNVEIPGHEEVDGEFLCSAVPEVSSQVMYFAMAMEGVRQFFDDPLAVMLAYAGSSESQLLPSAKVGQPVGFLSVSQLPSFIDDMMSQPDGAMYMARFLPHSPAYREMVAQQPELAVDPLNPRFPQWSIQFNRSGLMRSVTTRTPRVFRIRSTGSYGTSTTEIETVVDFGKTIRRLPQEEQLLSALGDDESEEAQEIRDLLRQEREEMPNGRVLYWRVH